MKPSRSRMLTVALAHSAACERLVQDGRVREFDEEIDNATYLFWTPAHAMYF